MPSTPVRVRKRNEIRPPRVNFGERWVDSSILEVLREDAIRFRILLTQAVEEDSLEVLANGGIPALAAWRLITALFGDGIGPVTGLSTASQVCGSRRVICPSGPIVIDEMANAAFFLGLLTALPEEFGDIRQYMTFDEAKSNFFNAARYGLNGQIKGLDGKSRRASRLILEELLPRARKGLIRAGVDEEDGRRLLDVIESRVKEEKTGARWMLDSYAGMDKRAKSNVRMRTLTAAMMKHQDGGEPMHEWELAEIPEQSDWIDNYKTVEQFMAVDLYTVRSEDIIDLAASLMHWRQVRHVPVEDDSGCLVGIVSHRDLIELLAMGKCGTSKPIIVRDVMKTELITVTPETSALEALTMMRELNIGCLPVLKDDHLVGLVTSYDFLTVSAKLFEERLLGVLQPPELR